MIKHLFLFFLFVLSLKTESFYSNDYTDAHSLGFPAGSPGTAWLGRSSGLISQNNALKFLNRHSQHFLLASGMVGTHFSTEPIKTSQVCNTMGKWSTSGLGADWFWFYSIISFSMFRFAVIHRFFFSFHLISDWKNTTHHLESTDAQWLFSLSHFKLWEHRDSPPSRSLF